MDYSLSLTQPAAAALKAHLLSDRSREQMAVTLCGVNRLYHELRLLVRDVIQLPEDAFRHQTAVRLELKPEVQAFIHQRAHRHGLVQVDWHSHPGRGAGLAFSGVDDRHEEAQAAYLAHRMDGVPYGSVVINDDELDARIWLTRRSRHKSQEGQEAVISYRPQAYPLKAVLLGDLKRQIPLSTQRLQHQDATQAPTAAAALSPCFDRQVRAFGGAFQRKLALLRVGIVGVGGLGSALVDHLARLGVRDWVLVDPDVVELTNLNRLVNATLTDAQKGRPKVYVARSTARQANPKARVRALQCAVFAPQALHALKACDLLIAATDNHSSRMALNRLAMQYLIPLLHVGFNISVGEQGKNGRRPVTDVSGELVLPQLGKWCLQCGGIIDPQQAGWELAPAHQREVLRQRGYVADTPAPAVRHLDGVVASLAAAEVHNLVHPFKSMRRYLVYDALRAEMVQLEVTASAGCPVCDAEQGVLGLGDLEQMPDYQRMGQVLLPREDELVQQRLADSPPIQAPSKPESMMQLSVPLPDRRRRVQRMQKALDEQDPIWP